MKVLSLTLRNFRNVRDCTLYPDARLNFLIGANGQGKTSFLEALGYLGMLRSFRGSKTDEVVLWGEPHGEVICILGEDDWLTELKVVFSREERSKVAFINGKAFRSSSQYLSQRFGEFELGFHTVVFNPADHDLVRGEPAVRRSFLDRVLSAEDVEYLKILQKYQRVVQQRNALLKAMERPDSGLLSGFSEPLARYGAWLVDRRLEWLERAAEPLNNVLHQIAPEEENLKAVYLSNWAPQIRNLSCSNNSLETLHFAGQEHRPSVEILEQTFWNQLSTLEATELRMRTSLVGPHRDDWTFLLGNQVLKGHGSQGEVRSALLALKLCEIELFRQRTGHRPLFLLDDFSSELDENRRSFLLRYLQNTDLQVFVTTTDNTLSVGKRFRVIEGRAEAVEADDNSDERSKRLLSRQDQSP